MTTHLLPLHRDNALMEVEELLPEAIRGDLDLKRLLFLCEQYRIAAICDLFLMDDAARPLRWLHASGCAFVHGLRWIRERGMDVPISRCVPLLDAILCRDAQTAKAISELLTSCGFLPDLEYEEDHLYHRWIQGTVSDMPQPERDGLVERLAALAEDDPRVELCRALDGRNVEGFDQALDLMIDEHARRYRQLAEDERIAPEAAASLGQFFHEGAALIQLARTLGMTTQDDYRLVPSSMITFPSLAHDPESWRSVPEV
ncbi:MAG: immunity 49 family protein [Planctomycetes bacterium]|nr:immunity 49 family protein [Planctomycetota bacterium]MCB9890881.1 immunity 49 family protein [Planctomycetota bacterium]